MAGYPMESSKQPQDEKFFELMLRATHIAFEYAKRAEADGKYIRSHSGFPTVRFFDNGFPYIGKDIYSKVKDYSYIFTDVYPEIKIEDLPEFQVLLDYIRSHETLKQYFMPTDTWGGAFEILAWRVPLQLLDRYMHAYKDQDFIVKNFLEIYLPIETGLLSTRLDIHVAVPILFVKFDFDAIEIGPGAYVGKMNDLFQLARIDITSNNSRG